MFGRRQNAEIARANPGATPQPQPGSRVAGGPAEAASTGPASPPAQRPQPQPVNPVANEKRAAAAKAVFERIQIALLERIDASAAAKLPREELQRQIAELIGEIVAEEKLSLTSREQHALTTTLVDDMVGLGRSSRSWPTNPSTTSWSTAPTRSMSSARASSS